MIEGVSDNAGHSRIATEHEQEVINRKSAARRENAADGGVEREADGRMSSRPGKRF